MTKKIIIPAEIFHGMIFEVDIKVKSLAPNEYQCAKCRRIFEFGWSDEEAKAEAAEIFGKPVEEWNEPGSVICDDCWNEINPLAHPEILARVKETL